ELMTGGSLEDRLRAAKPSIPQAPISSSPHGLTASGPHALLFARPPVLPLEDSVRIAAELCSGLEHCHTHGVIHRDLKPANVWLTAEGHAKLGDFGLAIDVTPSRRLGSDVVAGSVAYLAPECALGQTPDARSDLYGLGVMLYELVTGRLPFVGDDVVSVLHQHIHAAPVLPSALNPAVPEALDALALNLLAKAPEERPGHAAAVRASLLSLRRVL